VSPVPETLASLVSLLEATWADWQTIRLDELSFAQAGTAERAVIALAGVALAALVARLLLRPAPGRGHVALPSLVALRAASPLALIRHGALLLALAGIPFFILALADPRTAVTREEVTYPGRRISLMIDASSSMLTALPGNKFAVGAPNNAAFFTTVGAARYFIERRMKGKYRDLMSLIEFGDYVITPFTTDYQNILLSLSLIGNMTEWENFPDQGTVIAQAVEQAVSLFRAFDFLDASGNLMVIFSDGEDAEVTEAGRTIDDVLADAVKTKIPVYFVRISKGNTKLPDEMWRRAVEKTGGRFYTAADEATILKAISEIDRASAGTVEIREYSTRLPRFSPFALVAVALWTLAGALRLGVPVFQTFP